MTILNPGWKTFLVASSFFCTSAIGSQIWDGFKPLASVFAGASFLDSKNNQSYIGTDDSIFTYHDNNNSRAVGLIGLHLGLEKTLSGPQLLLQTGLEFSQQAKTRLNGQHFAGNEPETSTAYIYNYHFRTQQLLVIAKLLKSYKQIYHPYVSIGLGAAFNHLSDFKINTIETGSINLTPHFSKHSETAFSYLLGFGVDTDITEHVRLGLGYRFTDLGHAAFNNGKVVFNQYQYPSPFNFKTNHNNDNQVVFQLTYLA